MQSGAHGLKYHKTLFKSSGLNEFSIFKTALFYQIVKIKSILLQILLLVIPTYDLKREMKEEFGKIYCGL